MKKTKKPSRSLVTEPINIITGAQGAAKTLFAIAQADALLQHGDAKAIFQIGINNPDLRKLPALPFPLSEWHLPQHSEIIKDAVIIVDEFHEVMPQRGPGKPPEFVQQMAQARKRGVRFIFITQSVEFDHFVKGSRCNRHFHLERKGGFGATTIHEWANQFVSYPVSNKEARKDAIVHRWRHPKQYFDWYESAASHHFRLRIPFRLLLVPVFLVAVVFFIFKAWGNVGSILGGVNPAAEAAEGGKEAMDRARVPQDKPKGKEGVLPVTTDSFTYQAQFRPLVPEEPWSAPAYQDRPIVADPQILCVGRGAVYGADRCNCYTEQMTRLQVDHDQCWAIARHGRYNPYRAPFADSGDRAGEADGKGDISPRPSDGADAASAGVVIGGTMKAVTTPDPVMSTF